MLQQVVLVSACVLVGGWIMVILGILLKTFFCTYVLVRPLVAEEKVVPSPNNLNDLGSAEYDELAANDRIKRYSDKELDKMIKEMRRE